MCKAPAPLRASTACGPELADIVRIHGQAYLRGHRVGQDARRALRAIETCRTSALGGHIEICDRCGLRRAVFHSCCNRHCPKCQVLAKQQWLQARMAELLPIEYFHVVFTLPHELNALAQAYPRVVYRLLFRTAADTLLCFGADPKHLGALIGITAILHTWGQNLSRHIHLHCVVTGGGLSPDGSRWISSRKRFLFPVRAMSEVFRGKYLEALGRAANGGELGRTDDVQELARAVARQAFIVYAKRPFAGPKRALQYLGRYTHRVAISNNRIVEVTDTAVAFRWRDYRDGNRVKLMQLAPEEFLRRFLAHVLPAGFTRIRYFGLLANRSRRERIDRCRQLLGHPPQPAAQPRQSTDSLIERLTGVDIARCPQCGQGTMRKRQRLARGQLPPSLTRSRSPP